MPIEIRELVIKTTVGDTQQGSQPSGGAAGGGNTEAIVRACVEIVMEKLKEKQER